MNDVQRQPIQAEAPARFTASEFGVMTAAGAFSEFAGKIELVEGVIVRMSPAKSLHFAAAAALC
jgi:hypothetical protein